MSGYWNNNKNRLKSKFNYVISLSSLNFEIILILTTLPELTIANVPQLLFSVWPRGREVEKRGLWMLMGVLLQMPERAKNRFYRVSQIQGSNLPAPPDDMDYIISKTVPPCVCVQFNKQTNNSNVRKNIWKGLKKCYDLLNTRILWLFIFKWKFVSQKHTAFILLLKLK